MKTLEKAFMVLEYLMETGEAGVTEISQHLNLSKNNVFRALITFEEHGLVEKDEETEKYKLSVNAVRLGYGYTQKNPFIKLSEPVLKNLRFQLNETVNLAVLDDRKEYIVYVAEEETIKPVKVKSRLGKRFTIDSSTASAKALRKAVLGDEGFVFDYEYSTESELAGGACIVRDYMGNPIGAIEVLAPIYRLSLDKIEKELKPLLKEVALELSLKLGYWD
ncbi:MAG TPA: IclR family transcriptional regulator [Aquifex aeolicus]|nr:IclR family transcriptional regulator [Aquifex aeolicus]